MKERVNICVGAATVRYVLGCAIEMHVFNKTSVSVIVRGISIVKNKNYFHTAIIRNIVLTNEICLC